MLLARGNLEQASEAHSYWSASDLQAEVIMNYHVGETVLSLQKTTLIPGGSESLVYTTLSGGIGILVPFTSHEVSSPTLLWLLPSQGAFFVLKLLKGANPLPLPATRSVLENL